MKQEEVKDNEIVMLTKECSAILQHKFLGKLTDLGSFTILDNKFIDKVLCDLGVSINLNNLSLLKKLGLEK